MEIAPTSSAPLLRLPAEVLLKIFSYTAGSTDQLCFALACRLLLQTSTLLASLQIPSAPKHRTRGYCIRTSDLLVRLKPRDARGRAKTAWALCCICLRYRPTRLPYWKGKPRADASEERWSDVVRSWKSRDSAECPECWSEERKDVVALRRRSGSLDASDIE